MIRRLFALALFFAAPVSAEPKEFLKGADYDPAIPAPEAVVGHALGERLTPSGDIRRYFEALRQAAPDRMAMGEYGRTWEGRGLPWAAISSPTNIARLEEIRTASLALADPRRTDAATARALMARQPVVVWLSYSVHGDELSPAEAAMGVARHLLASRGDPRVASMLENTVVMLIPTQNPDGRDRFIAGHEAARGLEVDSDSLSAERAQTWPSGRFNHYLFDLNRDWFAQTQPETRGHSALMLGWRPQVVADAHEMDTDQSFFFPPEADPLNPLLPAAQVRSRTLFGRAHAAMFDRAGLDYFTREIFDAFYPGYGDNWPSYFGAISMTYEQAGTEGLAGRRRTGETLTLFDAVRSHFLVSLSTIETAAANREQFLGDFYAYHQQAMREGRSKGSWLLPRSAADPGAADRLAEALARQGLEVHRAETGFSACGRRYEAGTYILDMSQPQNRLAQVLLDPSIALKPEFLAEQERRRKKGLPAELYDVTAWVLPAMFNTPASTCRGVPGVSRTLLAPADAARGTVGGVEDAVAYVVPAGSQALRFLARGLRDGLRIRSADAPFTLGGRAYPGGSLVLTRAGNPADLRARVLALAAAAGAEVVGVPETWVTQGPSLGSDRTPLFVAPRIALAWGDPTSPPAAGAVRYLIEREYGYPVTVIRTNRLTAAELSRYDVLILPDGGNYRDILGKGGISNLKGWVDRGGVLIGLGRATAMMAHPESEMLATRRETLADDESKDKPKGDKDDKSATVAGTRLKDDAAYASALRPDKPDVDSVPGVLASAIVDQDHWLAAGAAPKVSVLVEGSAIYTPLKLDQGVNVARFADARELVVAGQLWEENRLQLAYKPFVMAQPQGRGHLIAFTQDPTLRAYLRGLDVLFLNAIFRGAAHASPVR
ncbi:MAG TPA: M14 family metallopeptidase [Allosphingosinicella sp.]|jgi:hypothetical protein